MKILTASESKIWKIRDFIFYYSPVCPSSTYVNFLSKTTSKQRLYFGKLLWKQGYPLFSRKKMLKSAHKRWNQSKNIWKKTENQYEVIERFMFMYESSTRVWKFVLQRNFINIFYFIHRFDKNNICFVPEFYQKNKKLRNNNIIFKGFNI